MCSYTMYYVLYNIYLVTHYTIVILVYKLNNYSHLKSSRIQHFDIGIRGIWGFKLVKHFKESYLIFVFRLSVIVTKVKLCLSVQYYSLYHSLQVGTICVVYLHRNTPLKCLLLFLDIRMINILLYLLLY